MKSYYVSWNFSGCKPSSEYVTAPTMRKAAERFAFLHGFTLRGYCTKRYRKNWHRHAGYSVALICGYTNGAGPFEATIIPQ